MSEMQVNFHDCLAGRQGKKKQHGAIQKHPETMIQSSSCCKMSCIYPAGPQRERKSLSNDPCQGVYQQSCIWSFGAFKVPDMFAEPISVTEKKTWKQTAACTKLARGERPPGCACVNFQMTCLSWCWPSWINKNHPERKQKKNIMSRPQHICTNKHDSFKRDSSAASHAYVLRKWNTTYAMDIFCGKGVSYGAKDFFIIDHVADGSLK